MIVDISFNISALIHFFLKAISSGENIILFDLLCIELTKLEASSKE